MQTQISKLKFGFTTRFAKFWHNYRAIIGFLAAVLVNMKTSQNILRQFSIT